MSSAYEQNIDLDQVNALLDARLRESSPRSHTHEPIERIKQRLNISPMGYFLLRLAKADLYAVSICTDNSRNNLFGLGMMVLFTAILALLTSWYTFSTMLLSPDETMSYVIGFGLALVYMFGIIIIDREIVSAVSSNLWSTVIRLVFAMLIATAISYPIKLKLFEGRIQTVIEQMIEEENAEKRAEQRAIRERFQSLRNEQTAQKQETINSYREQMRLALQNAERESTLERGFCGPRCIAFQEQANTLRAAVLVLESELVEMTQNVVLPDEARERIEQIEQDIIRQKEHSYDLLTKWRASERLKEMEGASYYVVSLFVMVFFFALEMVPALLKMALGKSEYNYYLEARQNLNSQKIVSIANLYIQEMQRDPVNALRAPAEITEWMHASMEDEATPYVTPRRGPATSRTTDGVSPGVGAAAAGQPTSARTAGVAPDPTAPHPASANPPGAGTSSPDDTIDEGLPLDSGGRS